MLFEYFNKKDWLGYALTYCPLQQFIASVEYFKIRRYENYDKYIRLIKNF